MFGIPEGDAPTRRAVVLILGGTNDIGRGIPPKIAVGNLLALHARAHRVGAITGVLTVPEFRMGPDRVEVLREERDEVNAALRDYVKEHPDRTFLVDVAASLPQDGADWKWYEDDGVHFTPEGSKALGDLVAAASLPKI